MNLSLLLTIKLVILGEVQSRLVVLHDESFSQNTQHTNQPDLTEAVLSSLAMTFNTQLATYKVTNIKEFYEVHKELKPLDAVMTIGVCTTNNMISSLGKETGLSLLQADTQPCKDTHSMRSLTSIPLHMTLNNRKYACLNAEVLAWVVHFQKQKLSAPFKKNFTERNHFEEFMDCIGENSNLEALVDSKDSIETKNLPLWIQLERGKKFLNGRELVIATIHRPPFIILNTEGDQITDASGFCITMLSVLSQKFNFTYRLVLPYDGNWGNLLSDGSVNGMIGMVHRKEVDFAAAGFTITQSRQTVVDFTHPFTDEPTTILIPAPKQQDNLFAFLNPFSVEVWSTLFVTVWVVSLSTWILSSGFHYLPLLYPFRHQARESFAKFYWNCAFTLLSQSIGHRVRQTRPARVLLGVWWIMNVILIYTYTSNLIASLTVPKMKILIDSLEALANQREILWTYRTGSAHEGLFDNAQPPGDFYKIGQLMKEKPNLKVTSNDQGLAMVLNENMAFIKEKSFLDFAMEEDYLKTGKCRLAVVPQLFFSAFFGWPMQQNCSYTQLFNSEILRMMQHGMFNEWRRRFWPKPNKCTAKGSGVVGPRPLHLRNLYGHFLILGFGFLISVLILLLEKWIHSGMFEYLFFV